MSKVSKQLEFLNRISYTTTKPLVKINPAKCSGIRLTFQAKNFNGHMGPRALWRKYLPTLQFYNPWLKIDIIRVKNEDKKVDIPCTLDILGKDGEVVDTIDMKNKMYDKIFDELLGKVEHEPVPETELVKI